MNTEQQKANSKLSSGFSFILYPNVYDMFEYKTNKTN